MIFIYMYKLLHTTILLGHAIIRSMIIMRMMRRIQGIKLLRDQTTSSRVPYMQHLAPK